MVYMDGDNNLENFAIEDFNELDTVEANEDACSIRYQSLHEGQRVIQEDIKKILEKM